jgi:hypothetical protein
MPLTDKGAKIMSAMKEKYGGDKGEEVFYASKNKGTISGVDAKADAGIVMQPGGAKADKGPDHEKIFRGKENAYHIPVANDASPLARAEAKYDEDKLLASVSQHCDSISARLDACEQQDLVRNGKKDKR